MWTCNHVPWKFTTFLRSRFRLINDSRSSLEPPEGEAWCLWCASRGVNEATMTSIMVSIPITHRVIRAKHICICKTDHHWLRYWLVACSAPSHYLNQWWHIVNLCLENTPQWYLYQNTTTYIQENELFSSFRLFPQRPSTIKYDNYFSSGQITSTQNCIPRELHNIGYHTESIWAQRSCNFIYLKLISQRQTHFAILQTSRQYYQPALYIILKWPDN